MPTEALGRSWLRLAAETAIACALWAVLLVGFARLASPPASSPAPPLVVEIAQAPTAEPRPAIARRPPAPPRPIQARRPRPPARQRPRPEPARPRVAPTVARAPLAQARPVPSVPPAEPPASPEAPPEPASAAEPQGGYVAARVVRRELPPIPEDLREQFLNTEVVVAFAVAADGSAQLELVEASASPRLNAIILEALRRWTFEPALREGVPVPSRVEVRIPVTIE